MTFWGTAVTVEPMSVVEAGIVWTQSSVAEGTQSERIVGCRRRRFIMGLIIWVLMVVGPRAKRFMRCMKRRALMSPPKAGPRSMVGRVMP